MSIFSSGGDVIDLPELHRKGLVKFPKKEEEIDEIDFTLKREDSTEIKKEGVKQTENSGVTDFFSDFASIGVSNAVEKKEENIEPKTENSEDLKWRIENTEYKIDQILERLVEIEKRLSS